jgi:hypothetical protein
VTRDKGDGWRLCVQDYVFDMATLYNMRLDMRNILVSGWVG